MAVINQISLINNVGDQELYDIETKITTDVATYISNQVTPDDYEGLAVPNTSGAAYTADFDMEVSALCGSVSGVAQQIYVNDVLIGQVQSPLSGQACQSVCTFFLKKGDTFYITRGSSAMSAPSAYCRRYRNRDYSTR